jgi:hypothetical protein
LKSTDTSMHPLDHLTTRDAAVKSGARGFYAPGGNNEPCDAS